MYNDCSITKQVFKITTLEKRNEVPLFHPGKREDEPMPLPFLKIWLQYEAINRETHQSTDVLTTFSHPLTFIFIFFPLLSQIIFLYLSFYAGFLWIFQLLSLGFFHLLLFQCFSHRLPLDISVTFSAFYFTSSLTRVYPLDSSHAVLLPRFLPPINTWESTPVSRFFYLFLYEGSSIVVFFFCYSASFSVSYSVFPHWNPLLLDVRFTCTSLFFLFFSFLVLEFSLVLHLYSSFSFIYTRIKNYLNTNIQCYIQTST